MKLWKICFLIAVLTWPLSLFLSNTPSDFASYFLPSFLVGLFLYFKSAKFKIANYFLLLIPLTLPQLAIFPLTYFLLETDIAKKKKKSLFFIGLASIVLLVRYHSFVGQTIIQPNYQARQEVLRNITLYPNIPLARIFQNKLIIISNKFGENIFALLDPNNYFFGFAPRQIVGNQNLIKFPFMAIFVFLLYFFNNSHKKLDKVLVYTIVALLLNLSVLTNFDRIDFVLWIPFSAILYFVFQKVEKLKNANLFFVFYLIFSFVQIVRLFITR